MTRVFIDTNIPLYAADEGHPLKAPANAILAHAADHPERYMTDAEVLQEMLHVYRRRSQDLGVIADFARIMRGQLEPIWDSDVLAACDLAAAYPRLGSRDLIHVAVCFRTRAAAIVTGDAGFEGTAELPRLDPIAFDTWRPGGSPE